MTTDFRSDVFTSEIDLSFTTQLRASSWAVILGASKEGPLDPTFVTDGPDGVSVYGKPDAAVSFMHHSMLAFLEEGGGAWMKRVTDGTAEYGGAMITNRNKDIELDAANADAKYMWGDGTTLWVLNTTDAKMYAYTIGTGQRDSDKDIDLETGNDAPAGMHGNGTHIWVLDTTAADRQAVRLQHRQCCVRQRQRRISTSVRQSTPTVQRF